jgi:glutathione S-transferase
VPVLVDEGFAVWDTLAIAEYLAERDAGVWPGDTRARARARSLCAEMHAGFGALRECFPMNLEADLSSIGHHVLHKRADAKRDLDRIVRMWTDALAASGGPFLFGAFSNADAYYAPVVSRIATYALPVPPELQPYIDRIRALPAMQQWTSEALEEHDWVADDEPYRQQA